MARYIDADEALRQLKNCKADNPCKPPYSGIWDTAMVIAIDVVRSMPSADVVERKRGEWTRIDYRPFGHDYICGICNKSSAESSDFCPHCGADMRGEQNA